MKRPSLYILTGVFFVACAGDGDDYTPTSPESLTIPIEVCDDTHDLSYTRATDFFYTRATTGDPGFNKRMPAPKYLYIWADVTKEDDGTQVIHYVKKTDLAVTGNPTTGWSWTATSGEVPADRWRYTASLSSGITLKPGTKMQVYIIASQDDLSTEIAAALGTGYTDYSTATEKTTNTDAERTTLLVKLEALTLDLSTWCTTATAPATSAAVHSTALGNLYSTPWALAGAGTDDGKSLGKPELLYNGTYDVVKVDDKTILEGTPTRLYHCAAKADFKWEVPESLPQGATGSTQATTKLESINLTNLPTTLNVFNPTHNPTGTGACLLLAESNAVNALNIGNWWVGREVAYVLQPPVHNGSHTAIDSKINYTVRFTGTPAKPDVDRTTPSATNPVFTTWYRTIADVK